MKAGSGLVTEQELALFTVNTLGPTSPTVLPLSGCRHQGVPSLDAHLFCLKDTMLCFHSSLQIKTIWLSLSLADHYSLLASNGEAPPPDLYYWYIFGGKGMVTIDFNEPSSGLQRRASNEHFGDVSVPLTSTFLLTLVNGVSSRLSHGT